MKKCLYIIAAALLIGLSGATWHLWSQNNTLTDQLSSAIGNEKALLIRTDSLNNKARVLQLTAEQLDCYNGFLTENLRQVRDSLKIKDKNLKWLQCMASTATKTDTVHFRDTIFNSAYMSVDTTLTDGHWYSLQLSLDYPNQVAVAPSFTSEKYVVISSKRETVNPPKRFFLFRWLQKRHTVIEADIVEKNPYIQNKENRFIEIIK